MKRVAVLLAALVAVGLFLLSSRLDPAGEALERTTAAGPDAPAPVEAGVDSEAPVPGPGPVLRGDVPPPAPEAPIGQDECAVRGRVVHADTGAPLAGVSVGAVSRAAPGDGRRLGAAVSDADGGFLLRGFDALQGHVLLLVMGGAWVNAEVARELATWDAMRAWDVELRPGEAVPWILKVRPGAHLEGTVHDADGAPVVGALVRVPAGEGPGTPAWSQPVFPWHLIPAVRTDADGRFALRGLPHGNDLKVEALREDGVRADSATVSLRPPDVAQVAIVLPRVRAARVRVVDAETGEALAEATAEMRTWLRRRAAYWGAEASTDDRGVAILTPVSTESGSLHVSAFGYHAFSSRKDPAAKEDAWTLFAAGGDGMLETTVRLRRAATVSGRVVGLETWLLKLVRVYAKPADGEDAPYVSSVPCDAEGRFALTVPPDRQWTLELGDLTEEYELAEEVEAPSGAADVVLRMRPRPTAPDWAGNVWELRLAGASDHAPTGATANVYWRDSSDYPPLVDLMKEWTQDWVVFEEHAGPDGEPALVGKVPVSSQYGEIWVGICAHAGDVTLPEVLHGPLGPEGGSATITLRRPRRIEGRVVDPAGRPVQGVELEVFAHRPEGMPDAWFFWGYRDEAISDAEGRFVLRDMHAGPYEVRVEAAVGWVRPRPLDVEAGTHDVVVQLLGGTSVTVTVRDEHGIPVEGALVRAHQQDGVRGPDADYWVNYDGLVTDAQGVAVLEALEMTGTFTLEVGPPRARFEELLYVLREGWTPRDETVVLATYRQVAGEVRTPAGDPVEGARVMAEWANGNELTTSDVEGRFVLRKVAPGAVRLGAWLPSLKPGNVRAALTHETEAGAADVVLVLDAGRSVRLAVAGLSGGEERVKSVRLTAIDTRYGGWPVHELPLPRGAEQVVVRGLRPGVRYRAWAGPTEAGHFAWATLEAEDAEAELVSRQGGTVTGTIRWAGAVDTAWIGIDHEGVYFGRWISDQPETFTLRGVPESSWPVTLYWRADGEASYRHLPATAGDHLVFDLGEKR